MKSLTLVNVSKGFEKGIMPLGLLSISAYLKKHGSLDSIAFLDSNCQDIYRDFKPADAVGISAVTQDIARAVEFARFVKEHHDIPVILGGVHITTHRKLPEPFDLGVAGEGEETMLELSRLDSLDKQNIRTVAGICYNERGKTIFSRPRELIVELDRIPMPDRDLANLDFYLQRRKIIPYHQGRSLTMITSRGCPYSCAFCSTRIHWQKYRSFSPDRILEEIEMLIEKYAVEIIHIFDDLFVANKKRLKQVRDRILEKRIHEKVKFMCLIRSDLLDEPAMKMLKEINVVVTGVGMESGCEQTLGYLKKNSTTIEVNRRAIELSNKYEIPVMGSFMVGSPNETEGEMLETLAFIRGYRYSPYLIPLSYISTAFPGTDFWDYAKARGIDVEAYDKIVMDIPDRLEPLKSAPLLTEVPVERFYEIVQLFLKETLYENVKKLLFLAPYGPLSLLKAYRDGIRIEKSVVRGVAEVTKMLLAFCKLKVKNVFGPGIGSG